MPSLGGGSDDAGAGRTAILGPPRTERSPVDALRAESSASLRSLEGEDNPTEARARTEVMPRSLLPPMDGPDAERTELLAAEGAEPAVPLAPPPKRREIAKTSRSPEGLLAKPSRPSSAWRTNLPFFLVAAALFAVALVIFATSMR